ncbi:hypothetical protein BDBG_16826 [Blastomyces gilchristii SLH14081]|uniref:Uncharacterized protein n=1 Tax=Blastomyces gilchristii (strain SLH14081) TaxID=559298 RepID=A0A179UH52_BLAGS|nr:uncharacterized protein BDBG_16826 [Blastomyces gilchristii SLH14081]OAT07376.1 hypothetical protein BDBG_16826 [Blastomyces gilchristii SLH14081]
MGPWPDQQTQSAPGFAFANDELIFSHDGLVPSDSLGLNETDRSSFNVRTNASDFWVGSAGSPSQRRISYVRWCSLGEMNCQEQLVLILYFILLCLDMLSVLSETWIGNKLVRI